MPEDDIYGNKGKYERFLQTINESSKTGKYPCKNPKNLRYYQQLADKLETNDTSYVRRLRLFGSFKIILNYFEQDLSKVTDRKETDAFIRQVRTSGMLSTKTQANFIIDFKFIWKCLFPDKDSQGREDDSVPYVVRHLSAKIDKSREKRRDDILYSDEEEKLLVSMSQDPRMQAFTKLAVESLARPQELLYLKIKNIRILDDYAEIYVSEHGKEGTKSLQCIDSLPYVATWMNIHPLRNNPEAFFFINLGQTNKGLQMSVENVNKHIREHCKKVGIAKKITSYSLKRSGVTTSICRGDNPIDIQKRAGWTSTKQLNTYDHSEQKDAIKRQLILRGIEVKDAPKNLQTNKLCVICNTLNGLSDSVCRKCKRPLDRKKLLEREQQVSNELSYLREELQLMRQAMITTMNINSLGEEYNKIETVNGKPLLNRQIEQITENADKKTKAILEEFEDNLNNLAYDKSLSKMTPEQLKEHKEEFLIDDIKQQLKIDRKNKR